MLAALCRASFCCIESNHKDQGRLLDLQLFDQKLVERSSRGRLITESLMQQYCDTSTELESHITTGGTVG
jgi:hypothetical protein